MSPVSTASTVAFWPGGGIAPGAPSNVTAITKDAAATVSFLPPGSSGSSGISSYTVTPYISGVAQSATTTTAGSAGSIAGSNGSTYVQVPCTGLSNGTAYTFTVHASNSAGAGAESAQSGANTPLAGLVFGDDFNGPASGPIDPEWWVYTRCGYLKQNEVEYYLPDHCILDGSSNLLLIGEYSSYTGPGYPSAGGGSQTQPWRSGGCQGNVKAYAPAAGNTMTFETRTQVMPGIGSGVGMWPGLLWLSGSYYQQQWKTDPDQPSYNNTDRAEIDVQEWNPQAGADDTHYLNNYSTGAFNALAINAGISTSAAMHVYSAQWKPGVSINWYRDGSTNTRSVTANIPVTGCSFFLMLYLQIFAGGDTTTKQCMIDYVRVYDQNLG